MASGVYNQFKTEVMKGTVNLDTGGDAVKCILLDNNHAFTPAHLGYAAISANELPAGSGYATGGETLTNQAVTQDDTGNQGVFDADDVSWTSATFTAYHAALYDDTPTSPADPLIASIDFGSGQTVSNGTFEIQWDAAGIINIG